MIQNLNDASVARLVEISLHEDIGFGDATSEAVFDSDARTTATITAKESGIICGLPIGKLVFRTLNPSVEWEEEVTEGAVIDKGQVVARIEGNTIDILKGERTALNFMQRMSGVATLAHEFVEAVEGTGAKILDTRKTIPAWRLLDKYAVRIGGAQNHRFGLFDMVMIKDNHIAAAGSITEAIRRCQHAQGEHKIPIEVETQNLDDVREALACGGIQRVMFDNFSPDAMRAAVSLVDGVVETEASGGITLANVRQYAETGVDYISVGAVTHSVKALDLSMNF